MKTSRVRPPVQWLGSIPRRQRHAVDTKHACYFHHQPLWKREHFDDCEINVTGNLLIVAARGGLILRRGAETQIVHEGEGCLVAPGLLAITEVPSTAVSSADVYYFFFDDRLVRRSLGGLAKVERMALAMAPAPTVLPRLPNFLAHLPPILAEGNFRFPNDFTRVLNVVLNHGWSGAWMFLKTFFARRHALHLHLEKYVFPITSVEALMNAYSGGRRQFGRDYRAQYDVPVERWLTWRRLEVARLKIRYENSMTVEQVAAAAGYQNFQCFRHQFRHRFKLWPEEVCRKKSRDELSPQHLAPFWHWSYPEPLYIREAATAFIGRTQDAQYPRRVRQRRWQQELPSRHEDISLFVADDRFLTPAGKMDDAPTNILPFECSGFEDFIELEASLDPADMRHALAA